MARYLLPCPCGSVVPVDARQAGAAVTCRCGRRLDVPAMRELRTLATESAVGVTGTQRPWSREQGWLFSLGLAIALAGAAAGIYLVIQRLKVDLTRPRLEDLNLPRDVDAITPEKSLEIWEAYREIRLDERATPQFLVQRSRARELNIKLGVAAVFTVLGIGMTAGSFRLRSHGAAHGSD